MQKSDIKIGPVQLIAFGFDPQAKFDGRIMAELERLDQMNTIRILDLLFVKKEGNSDLITLSIQGEDMGSIVGALLGFEFEGDKASGQKTKTLAEDNHAFGLNAAQIEKIGQELEPDSAAGILLIEHVWAKPLKQAIRQTGGVPLAEGFITPEGLTKVASELQGICETMDSLEKEYNGKNHYLN